MNPKEGQSVSLQKFHRKSAQSTSDDSQIALPELKGRSLKSATTNLHINKPLQTPLRNYINESLQQRKRSENQSEYTFIETYLEALQRYAQEEKKKKQIQTLQINSFPILPGQVMRERIKKYAEIQQREVTKYFVRKEQQPKKPISTALSMISQKSIVHQESKTDVMSIQIPISSKIKHKVSSKKWAIFKRNKGETKFQKIYAFQDQQKSEVASITKVMTCYTTLKFLEEKKIDMEAIRIKIPGHAECIDGTSAFLNAGGIMNIRQLLFAMMLPSGNDAALVLSYAIAFLKTCDNIQRYCNGHYIDCELEIEKNKFQLRTQFLQMMNNHAVNLKMDKTNYNSVHGLNDTLNVSCALDIFKLVEECIKIKEFMEIVNTRCFKTYAITDQGKQGTYYKWKNTNKLLKKEGWEGIKTGITSNAGPCFSGYYKTDDFDAIVIVLQSSNMLQRFKDAEILIKLL
ncbi:unnamed protein product [Paramecium primaurelia]|uniref:Peptidase S11 D-alanyl-D-alanine carboxypeptidase A N-terminal domain-containing protein n=1 Tax=Paramecium primaurelia TaxID=5886 RepID=A0A8S1M6V5_PARPR|nr:unnamed protein product [Paramecium primaurelia]